MSGPCEPVWITVDSGTRLARWDEDVCAVCGRVIGYETANIIDSYGAQTIGPDPGWVHWVPPHEAGDPMHGAVPAHRPMRIRPLVVPVPA